MRANLLMTPAGQEELMTMIERRDARPSSNQSGSLPYATAAAQGLSEISQDRWIQIELTADTGACDSVIPKAVPCAHTKIHPSAQSESGMSYEVASSETIPSLGERCLSVWTEGAGPPQGMAIQVADAHKFVLSPSRCADLVYESQIVKLAGLLFDKATEDLFTFPQDWEPLHATGMSQGRT